jgi:hypothetical protein
MKATDKIRTNVPLIKANVWHMLNFQGVVGRCRHDLLGRTAVAANAESSSADKARPGDVCRMVSSTSNPHVASPQSQHFHSGYWARKAHFRSRDAGCLLSP